MDQLTPPPLASLYYERGFGGSVGFGSKPALIVVDMQVGFTDPGSALGSDQAPQIEQMIRLLSVFRRTRFPVFFLGIRYQESDCADAGIWRHKNAGVSTMATGSPGVELDTRLQRLEDEPLIHRAYPSGFFGTDLSTRLRTRGVDTVVTVGCTTSGCVRATVVDALSHGFRPIVAADAVSDRSIDAHNQSLIDIEAKYADVLRASEIIRSVEDMDPGYLHKEG